MSKFLKSFLTLAIALLIASCSSEEELRQTPVVSSDNNVITIDEAKQDLLGLLADIETADTESRTSHRTIESSFTTKLGDASSRSDEEALPIHVFNFADDNGFAIMSGDKRVPSLIALAEKGSFPQDTIIDNPGLAIFLERMGNQGPSKIKDKTPYPYVDPNDPETFKIYGEWENTIYKDYGYCFVKWGQRDPYNYYCPEKDGEKCATGCVATALAQLMSIYKQPSSYNGYSFDWEKMTLTSTPFEDAQKDIARLMQQLGLKKNLDMDYGYNSGAYPENIPRTLKAFGYSSGGKLVNYNTDDIVKELKLGYSVLVGGRSQKNGNGHRWLVHGLLERKQVNELYTKEGVYAGKQTTIKYYPLCNWGWEGRHDGYYLSNAFNGSPKFFDDGTQYSTANDPFVNYSKPDYVSKINMVIGIRK